MLPIMRECDGHDIVRVTLKGTGDGLASLGGPGKVRCRIDTRHTFVATAMKGSTAVTAESGASQEHRDVTRRVTRVCNKYVTGALITSTQLR